MDSVEKILRKNYAQRLFEERKAKGLFTTITLPEGQRSIKLLPIQNLFYGNMQCPPRLEILLNHIEIINDLEEGAFFLGGNLFYYPAGTTEEKAQFASNYAEDLSEILRKADKNKILFMYDGVNETKFLDDRKLKHPIETSKIVANNLGIEDKYYADTNVELKFVFNSDLTNFQNEFMLSMFSSIAPISTTINAEATKLKNLSLRSSQKNLIVDTSSSLFFTKKKVLRYNENKDLSYKIDQTLISPAGYTNDPQTKAQNKSEHYPINQRYIELKIEEKNPSLHQDSIRQSNTVKDDPFDRTATCLTIGVNYDSYIDFVLYQQLNDEIIKNAILKEEISKKMEYLLDRKLKQKEQDIYKHISNTKVVPPKSNKPASYTFE